MILISKDGKTKDITRKELNIIKDEICFCLHQGINQCLGSKAIIKELTNYVVEVEYKEAYLIFELSSQFTFIAKNKAFYRQQDNNNGAIKW